MKTTRRQFLRMTVAVPLLASAGAWRGACGAAGCLSDEAALRWIVANLPGKSYASVETPMDRLGRVLRVCRIARLDGGLGEMVAGMAVQRLGESGWRADQLENLRRSLLAYERDILARGEWPQSEWVEDGERFVTPSRPFASIQFGAV